MIDEILFVMFCVLTVIYSLWILLFFFPHKQEGVLLKYPVLSVILPAHNEGDVIDKTLESVLNASYPGEKEVVVVNDGSTDNTREVIEKAAARNGSIRLLNVQHMGKANALNKGVEASKGEIIVVLDADSRLDPNALAEIVASFADKDVGAVSGVIRAVVNNKIIVWFQDFEYVLTSAWRYVCNNINSTYILPGFAAFRRRALLDVGGFSSDTLSEDFDVGLRLRKTGYKLTMSSARIYTHVPQTIKDLARQRIRWGRGTLQVIRKHRDVPFSGKYGAVGLYGIPTQLYWFVHGFVAIPLTFYQIVRGYMLYLAPYNPLFSFNVLKYLFSWFTTYGTIEYAYKISVGEWPYTFITPLIILTFVLNTVYNLMALHKMSQISLRYLFTLFFFFPYSIFALAMYSLPLLLELNPLRRRTNETINIWDKNV